MIGSCEDRGLARICQGKGRIITSMAHSLGIGVGGLELTTKSFEYKPPFPLQQLNSNLVVSGVEL